MRNQDEQNNFKEKLEDALLSFYESSHGTYSELQEAWDKCEEVLGAMIPGNPAVTLFEEAVRFTLEVLGSKED